MVVFTALGLGYGLLQSGSYRTMATVASNVDMAMLKGQADVTAQQQRDAKVSISADTASSSLKIYGESKSDRAVVEAVNKVANASAAAARNMLPTATVKTSGARQASYSRRSPLVFAAIGFAGGAFLALCALVLFTDRKAPVHGARELEELTKIPVLGTVPAKDEGAMLAANVSFSTREALETVCLVPVRTARVAEIRDLLAKALTGTDGVAPRVVGCRSIVNSADAAYEAHAATVTVLVVSEWDDSLKDVERTLHELRIAKANVVGTVFVAS